MDPIIQNQIRLAVENIMTGEGSATVTPHNTNPLAFTSRSLYVTVGGTVKFVGEDGEEDTWTVPDNFIIPVRMTHVRATGTSATGLKAIK